MPRLLAIALPGCLSRRLLVLLLSALALSAGLGCSRLGGSGGRPSGLLAGRAPQSAEGVTHAERITDGIVPPVGSSWTSNRTALFASQSAAVVYDLGSSRPVEAVAVLADNNDDYVVSVSEDGVTFRTAYIARRSSATGLRWRFAGELRASGRYLRLQPRGGDRALSVAELVVYGQQPGALPPRLTERPAIDTALDFRHAVLLFALFALAGVVLAFEGASLGWNIGAAGLAAFGLYQLLETFAESFPVSEPEVALVRGVSAAVAAGVVAREAFAPRRLGAWRPLVAALLTVSAVLAVASFYNLGKPQFYDAKQRTPSVVHNFDMRVYYPVAKYFDELKYDGLYLASTLSYAEEHGGLDAPQLQATELRDLRDHRMRRVPEVRGQIEQVRSRFSDARWAEFKRDMAYFWETMGPGAYLGSMRDHGGNATPFWMALAHLMFRGTTASNEVLLLSGALDPLLLLLFGVCAWRAFGWRTALVSLVVFGANDFYMFGSNWAGATLRNDWMVYLGLGACALKVKRYALGGALLASSALIRAFPTIALLSLGVPVVYFVLERLLQRRRLPSPRELWDEQRWFFQVALGAAACVFVAVAFSSAVLGADSWPLWVRKISSFTASPHVNHISLLTVVAGSEGHQQTVLKARAALFVVATILYVVLALWAAHRRPPHAVALLGMLLMPVFMYPANYYIHFVFLLALLVDEPLKAAGRWQREASGKVWLLLLSLCAAQFFTVKEQSLDLHFYNASVLLMATLLAVLLAMLPRDEEGLAKLPLADALGRWREGSASGAQSDQSDSNRPPV